MSKEKLFNEFPPVKTEQWESVIKEDLAGADYEKKLIWKTNEGIKVKPYYRAEDLEKLDYLNANPGEFPYVRTGKTENNDWYIRQDITVDNPVEANKKALDILCKGVTSICFNLCCVEKFDDAFISKLLKDITLSAIEINFGVGKDADEFLPVFLRFLKANNYDTKAILGSVNFDPMGRLAKRGKYCCTNEEETFKLTKKILEISKELPNFRSITIHGTYFSNAGSNIVQELAFALSSASEYLSKLTDAGLKTEDITSKIKFSFGVGSNYFMEIAKFRAARLLWAKIVGAYDSNCKAAMNIHAETLKWNMSSYDPYVNMLRATTESMSAVLSGIDSLTVIPFDSTFEKPSELAERVARNSQIILKEESHFDKIIDPASGSYYIESLTDSIVTESWKLFLEVQNKGGYIAALKAGYIQSQIKEVAQKRDLNIATRREILLGTNQYPNFSEVKNEQYDDYTCDCCCEENSSECCCCEGKESKVVEPLKLYRGAEAFEALRLKTDLRGKRPTVFMMTMGNLAMRLARSQFSANFFGCAGFEIIDNIGFKAVDEAVKTALDKKSDIVVLCSSDDEYVTLAPEAYEKLKDKVIFVIAGEPACKADLQKLGIEHFISVKSNVLETLKGIQGLLK